MTESKVRRNILIIATLVLIFSGCSQEKKEPAATPAPRGTSMGKITYDTIILNPNADDTWTTECLSKFERKKLIDDIFDAVYAGKLTALDYFTRKKFTVNEVKAMEASGEFSRDRIGKIQFDEKWYWDEKNARLRKKVTAMTLGYEVWNNDSTLRGHKPVFRIEFN
ncbi:hypothetical protein PbJCM13498_20640 [Prolixibacter bellariivorans]|uniref:Lipoprotein n=1 Tax=Prolixibacter bellariivorans TaxID=314319 RepID=A0A5M4AZX6_9BACT|nr:hypothetical protein PbJCM13498_20640 [Prolixibacter bellariivorans]